MAVATDGWRRSVHGIVLILALSVSAASLAGCKGVTIQAGGPGGGSGNGSGAGGNGGSNNSGTAGHPEPFPSHIPHLITSKTDYWQLPGGIILPNGRLTPGATNPQVTQANIHSTICQTGFTSTIRPPEDYTTGLKRRQLAAGYSYHGDMSTGDYEEDHLISLELGGAPADPRNLWPEPYNSPKGAKVKDLVENKLHDEVCSGALPLAVAQQDIARDWWAAYQRYGGESYPKVWGGGYTGSAPSSAPSGAPSGQATARCKDGTYSYSAHRSGTCAGHGGVAHWIHEPSS